MPPKFRNVNNSSNDKLRKNIPFKIWTIYVEHPYKAVIKPSNPMEDKYCVHMVRSKSSKNAKDKALKDHGKNVALNLSDSKRSVIKKYARYKCSCHVRKNIRKKIEEQKTKLKTTKARRVKKNPNINSTDTNDKRNFINNKRKNNVISIVKKEKRLKSKTTNSVKKEKK